MLPAYLISLYTKRMWLDNVDEAIARYDAYPRPTKLERFIPICFEGWYENVQALEKEKSQHKDEDSITSFSGFGKSEDKILDWKNFLEWINYILEGERQKVVRV